MWVLKISAWLPQAPEDALHTCTPRWTQEIFRGAHELGREEWSLGMRGTGRGEIGSKFDQNTVYTCMFSNKKD